MKDQKDFNKVVNIKRDEDGNVTEILVLDYVFNSDSFKGATGTHFEPISKERYDEATDKESVIEYLIDSGLELPEQFKRGGFEAMYESMMQSEIDEMLFDHSYSELWDDLREAADLSEDEAYLFNCTGGGRCFDKNFEGNYNTELSKIIREYES